MNTLTKGTEEFDLGSLHGSRMGRFFNAANRGPFTLRVVLATRAGGEEVSLLPGDFTPDTAFARGKRTLIVHAQPTKAEFRALAKASGFWAAVRQYLKSLKPQKRLLYF